MWPLALAELAQEDREASIWVRVHARQALVLGVLGSLGFFIVLALPLAAVIAFPALSPGATIGVYAAGLLLDAIVAVGLVAVGVRCAARAARGELFAIPLVTAIVDRWFKLGDR